MPLYHHQPNGHWNKTNKPTRNNIQLENYILNQLQYTATSLLHGSWATKTNPGYMEGSVILKLGAWQSPACASPAQTSLQNSAVTDQTSPNFYQTYNTEVIGGVDMCIYVAILPSTEK